MSDNVRVSDAALSAGVRGSERSVDDREQKELSRLRQLAQSRIGSQHHLDDNVIRAMAKRALARRSERQEQAANAKTFESESSQSKRTDQAQKTRNEASRMAGTERGRGTDGLTDNQREQIRSDPDAGPTLPPTMAEAATPEQALQLMKGLLGFVEIDGELVTVEALLQQAEQPAKKKDDAGKKSEQRKGDPKKQSAEAPSKAKQMRTPGKMPGTHRALARSGAASTPPGGSRQPRGSNAPKSGPGKDPGMQPGAALGAPQMGAQSKLSFTRNFSFSTGDEINPHGILDSQGRVLTGSSFDGMNFNWDAFFSLFIIQYQKDMHEWFQLMQNIRRAKSDNVVQSLKSRHTIMAMRQKFAHRTSAFSVVQRFAAAVSRYDTGYDGFMDNLFSDDAGSDAEAYLRAPYTELQDQAAEADKQTIADWLEQKLILKPHETEEGDDGKEVVTAWQTDGRLLANFEKRELENLSVSDQTKTAIATALEQHDIAFEHLRKHPQGKLSALRELRDVLRQRRLDQTKEGEEPPPPTEEEKRVVAEMEKTRQHLRRLSRGLGDNIRVMHASHQKRLDLHRRIRRQKLKQEEIEADLKATKEKISRIQFDKDLVTKEAYETQLKQELDKQKTLDDDLREIERDIDKDFDAQREVDRMLFAQPKMQSLAREALSKEKEEYAENVKKLAFDTGTKEGEIETQLATSGFPRTFTPNQKKRLSGIRTQRRNLELAEQGLDALSQGQIGTGELSTEAAQQLTAVGDVLDGVSHPDLVSVDERIDPSENDLNIDGGHRQEVMGSAIDAVEAAVKPFGNFLMMVQNPAQLIESREFIQAVDTAIGRAIGTAQRSKGQTNQMFRRRLNQSSGMLQRLLQTIAMGRSIV